jgi:hypothetical protein
MRGIPLLVAAAVAVSVPDAAAAPLITATTAVRCKGSVSVVVLVRPGGRVLEVLDYTSPADGTQPKPTGRTWLSMTYRTQTVSRLCQKDPVLKRPRTPGIFGPYPRSNSGNIWCLVAPEEGFGIQLAPIRNKKRAVIGTRMLLSQGEVGHKHVVVDARLTRTGGGISYASGGQCLRTTGKCIKFKPTAGDCGVVIPLLALGKRRRRLALRRRKRRDGPTAARVVDDVDCFVLPVRPGNPEQHREPADRTEPALLGELTPEHQLVPEAVEVGAGLLADAVHVHLVTISDAGRKLHPRTAHT